MYHLSLHMGSVDFSPLVTNLLYTFFTFEGTIQRLNHCTGEAFPWVTTSLKKKKKATELLVCGRHHMRPHRPCRIPYPGISMLQHPPSSGWGTLLGCWRLPSLSFLPTWASDLKRMSLVYRNGLPQPHDLQDGVRIRMLMMSDANTGLLFWALSFVPPSLSFHCSFTHLVGIY